MLPAEIKFPSLNDGDLLAFPTELPQHEAPCSQLLRGEKGGALQWRCYIACAYHCSRCVARRRQGKGVQHLLGAEYDGSGL